jgi:MSHA biogenesis protein MshE
VCESCREAYKPEQQEIIWLSHLVDEDINALKFSHGRGCQACQYSGYKGRIGVFELLEMNEPMMAALKRDDTEAFTHAAKQHPGFRPLALAAFDYAKLGITSVEEVLRLVETVDVTG